MIERNYLLNMNFTSSEDDIVRFADAADLKGFYESFGLDGLELMPFDPIDNAKIEKDMVNGIHMVCIADWFDMDKDYLINHYRHDMEHAKAFGAKYVVFHAVQVNNEESYTYVNQHTDEEVIDRLIEFINELLDGQDYEFDFLMENLWWPGLTFEKPELAKKLFEGVHYPNKGFMLDTGHLMHLDLELKSEKEGIDFVLDILDKNEEMLPHIKGIHLQQSITGDYVKQWLSEKHEFPEDENELWCQLFTHLFAIDRHEPFTDKNVKKIIRKIQPEYVTLEYISRTREELAEYLKIGTAALS